jgi:hypothetical protein
MFKELSYKKSELLYRFLYTIRDLGISSAHIAARNAWRASIDALDI